MSGLHFVRQAPPSAEFQEAWQYAGEHLSRRGGDAIAWIRWQLQPPLAEHLAFRLGNQLVFVFVATDHCDPPSTPGLFLQAAREARAVPCFLPIGRRGTQFVRPSGWGLFHAETGEPYDPLAAISDERIEVSDWELHDMALQVIRGRLEKEGATVFSWQPSREIDPSIWFERDGERYWVAVRACRHPATSVARPASLEALAQRLKTHSAGGYFAQVGLIAVNENEEPDEKGRIYRGHPLAIGYTSIEPV